MNRDAASGVTRFDTDRGPGTYQVWLGVDGPSGFMPVSTFLEYPLFPDASGKNVIIPPDADDDGTPDFIAALDGKEDGADSANEAARTTPRRRRELWEAWSKQLRVHPPIPQPDRAKQSHRSAAVVKSMVHARF